MFLQVTVLTCATSCLDALCSDSVTSRFPSLVFALDPPTSLIKCSTEESEVQKKRGEACRHYSKTEFLSGFLLKAYYQVPVIKARKAPLDFLSP